MGAWEPAPGRPASALQLWQLTRTGHWKPFRVGAEDFLAVRCGSELLQPEGLPSASPPGCCKDACSSPSTSLPSSRLVSVSDQASSAVVMSSTSDARDSHSLAVTAFSDCDALCRERVLLRSCFRYWRQELSKFEAMERDLLAASQEARMGQAPATSLASASLGRREEGSSWQLKPSALILNLLGWAQRQEENAAAGLFPSLLAQHERRKGVPLDRGRCPGPAATDLLACASEGRQSLALSAVHRERAAEWCLHVPDGRRNFDESCSDLREGVRVLFDSGRRAGLIMRALPDRDEYVLCVRGKALMNEASPSPRIFRCDELDAMSEASSF